MRIHSEVYTVEIMSQENFNETSILNDTELINGTITSWRTDYEGDWWTILIVSSGILVKMTRGVAVLCSLTSITYPKLNAKCNLFDQKK